METATRLSDYDVHNLLREYRASADRQLRDQIVGQYTNLVESVARRYAGATEPAEDLIQEGYIGLLTAVEGYNADKGVKFSTYATHFIIGQIKHHLRDRGKIIKEPAWLQELNQRVTRAIESLTQQLGRAPSHAEVGKVVGMSEEAVAELMTTREVFRVSSLDGTDQDDDNPFAYDAERVRPAEAPQYELPVEDKLVLEAALCKLKQLEQTVIREFYFRGRSQTEIARTLGMSCNYVSHILRNSARKLKRIIATDDLREAHLEMALVRRRREEAIGAHADRSVLDGLTQLYSRRYFDMRLEEEVLRGSREQDPVAVLLVRLEGMEALGRAHGAMRADDAVRQAAELVRSSVRRMDIVARYDYETFALILPHTGHQVQVVADRLAGLLSKWMAEVGLDRGRTPVGLSFGSAWFPIDASRAADVEAAALESMRTGLPAGEEARAA